LFHFKLVTLLSQSTILHDDLNRCFYALTVHARRLILRLACSLEFMTFRGGVVTGTCDDDDDAKDLFAFPRRSWERSLLNDSKTIRCFLREEVGLKKDRK
jgi:hypothetical protein